MRFKQFLESAAFISEEDFEVTSLDNGDIQVRIDAPLETRSHSNVLWAVASQFLSENGIKLLTLPRPGFKEGLAINEMNLYYVKGGFIIRRVGVLASMHDDPEFQKAMIDREMPLEKTIQRVKRTIESCATSENQFIHTMSNDDDIPF